MTDLIRSPVTPVPLSAPAVTRSIALRAFHRNWHQATVYALATDDPADIALTSRASKMFAVSVFIVIIQCVTVCSVINGTLYSSCSSNDQCPQQGQFCGLGSRISSSDSNCMYCGTCKQSCHPKVYVLSTAQTCSSDDGLRCLQTRPSIYRLITPLV